MNIIISKIDLQAFCNYSTESYMSVRKDNSDRNWHSRSGLKRFTVEDIHYISNSLNSALSNYSIVSK